MTYEKRVENSDFYKIENRVHKLIEDAEAFCENYEDSKYIEELEALNEALKRFTQREEN